MLVDDVVAVTTGIGQGLVGFGEQQRAQAVSRTPHLRHPQGSDGLRAAARKGEVADGDAALGIFEDVLLHDAAVGTIDIHEDRYAVLRRVGRDTNHRFRVELRQRLDPLGSAERLGNIALRLQVNHFALHDIAAVGADIKDFRALRKLVKTGNRRFHGVTHNARVENRFCQFHIGRGGLRDRPRDDEQTSQNSHRKKAEYPG